MNRDEALELWQRVRKGELRNDRRIVLALQERLQKQRDGHEAVDPTELLDLIEEMASNFAEPVELIDWLEGVAGAVVSADSQSNSKQRPNDLVRAIGLTGKRYEHAELRRELDILESFETLDPPRKGEKELSPREFAYTVAVRLSPLLKREKKDALLQKLDDILAGIARPSLSPGSDATKKPVKVGPHRLARTKRDTYFEKSKGKREQAGLSTTAMDRFWWKKKAT